VIRSVCALACLLGLSACERAMHQMYDQPKYKPLTPTRLFPDGNSSRPQVEGTIVRSSGSLAASSSGREGSVAVPSARAAAALNPYPITRALLARGQERFDIYCAPCHSRSGDGDGMIVRRGFPAPPSYHIERLRAAPDSHFFQVITDGYGAMYPYADRIAPADRWAIVAYIRALQLSQHMPAELLDATDLSKLERGSR